MSWIPLLAVALAAITILAAVTTGKRLSEMRKSLFQVEMRAEALRRQVTEMDEDSQRVAGQARALAGLRLQKRETLAGLYDELRALRAGQDKEVGVSPGLRQKHFELEEMAA